MPKDSASQVERVVDALALFRQTYNNRIEFVQSEARKPFNVGDDTTAYWAELNDYAWDLSADGIALARAVAALLGQPEFKPMIED